MPALTITNAHDMMKGLNETYQPKGSCAATPAKMKLLVGQLEEYTSEVQWARNKYILLGIAGGFVAGTLLGGGDVDVPQWRADMTNWQYRLAEYARILDAVPTTAMNTTDGCRQIYTTVTAPLLDGIWYTTMPGIVMSKEDKKRIKDGKSHCPPGVETCTDIAYRIPEVGDHPPGHTSPKIPDAMAPFTLGNQIITYQDFQKENADRFFADLLKNAKDIGDPNTWPWWMTPLLIAGGGLVVGMVGLYAYQFLPQPARTNPRRKRRLRAA